MPSHILLTKKSIATTQLDKAIELYIEGSDLISALTLAGAAEEILGKQCHQQLNIPTALDETLDRLTLMHEALFNEKANRKTYMDIKNKARNQFKHYDKDEVLQYDLDREAASLINRAISNFKKLYPGYQENFKQFNDEWLKRNKSL